MAICVACAIPAVGAAVMGVAKTAKAVIKAKKAEKMASLAAEAAKMTKNAANTLDTLSDTMKAVSKWGDNPLKLADGITAEAGSRAMRALETGGDFAKESRKAVWEMKAVVGADGIRLSTKADEGASLLKQGFAGTDGVAKSAGKSSSTINWTNHGYKHFPDRNKSWKQTVKSTKSGPAKYHTDIVDIEKFEREAWEHGIIVNNGKNWKVREYDKVIGATNGKETKYVRIEFSSNTIHGHPISKSEYEKLLK